MTAAAAAANAQTAASQAAAAAGTAHANVVKLNTAQMQNMAFQMNDIATMLAWGQSPFVLLMQQGMQIAQIFGPGVGVAAALRASGAALMAFVTNPLTLAVVGLAAAAGGAQMLWRALTASDAADAAMEHHRELVDAVRDAYVAAGGAAENWRKSVIRITQLEADENLRTQQRLLERERAALERSIGTEALVGGSIGERFTFGLGIAPYQAEIKALRDLRTAAAEGEITLEQYRQRLDEIGRASKHETVRRYAAEMLAAAKDALKLEDAVREAAAAVATLNGTLAREQGIAALRQGLAGALVPATESIQAAFAVGFGTAASASAGHVLDGAAKAAQRHVDELKRMAAAWTEDALPAAERYRRELAKLAEAKSYFESEADYLRARVKLQNDMVKAIERERRERLAAATDMRSGIVRAFEDYAQKAADRATTAADAVTGTFSRMEDAAVAFVSGAKVDFSSLAQSILADFARLSVRSVIGPVASALGAAVGGMVSGGAAAAIPWSWGDFATAHGGYGPGDTLATRRVPAAVFAGARRLHDGWLAPYEVPRILRRDESVLTPGQMRAMGNRETTVRIELVDAQGAPVRASDGGRRREGGVDVQRLIVAAVTEDIGAGGPIAGMIQSTWPGVGTRRTR